MSQNATRIFNPFKPATPVAKKLKVMIFGASGTGKTVAALTFPGAAVIDTEGGTDLYAGRPGILPFSVLRAKSLAEVEQAVTFIQADNGQTFKTLVIDPITVLYDVQKEAASKKAPNNALGFREWALINNRMKALYNSLTNLPVHVVMVAREATEYEGVGNDLRKAGFKPDADRAAIYICDIVIRMNSDHSGTVVKSRGMKLGNNGRVDRVHWTVFETVANAYVVGETIQHISEVDAADKDTDAYEEAHESKIVAMPQQRQPVQPIQPVQNGNGHVTVPTALATPSGQRVGQPEPVNEPVQTWPCIELVDKVYTMFKTDIKVDDYQKSEFAAANGVTAYSDMSQWANVASGKAAYGNAWTIWSKPPQTTASEPQPTPLEALKNASIEIGEPDTDQEKPWLDEEPTIFGTLDVIEMEDSTDLIHHYNVNVISATYAIPQKKGDSPFLLFPVGDQRITKPVRCYGRSDKFKSWIGEEAYNKYGFNQYDDKRNGGVMLPLHPRLVLDIIEKGNYYSVENAWIDETDVTF